MNIQEYGFSEDHQQIFDMVDRYSREQLHPLLNRMDAEDWFPEEIYRGLSKDGLLGTTVPEDCGGAGLDFLSQCVAAQAMSYWNHCFAASWMSSENVCMHNLVRNCNEEQRGRFLPSFASGEHIGALGLTEPGAGSDAFGSMKSTARRDGDDYILNGRKMFITNAPVADIVLIYAKTEKAPGAKGITAFAVETDRQGFSIAQKLDKMGWRGSPTGEIVMDDVRVPASNVLGTEGQGAKVAMSGLNGERIMLGFHIIGLCQRGFDLALDYAKTREQFGQTIGEFQLVQAMLADMYCELEALKAMVYHVALKTVPAEECGEPVSDAHKQVGATYLKGGRVAINLLDHAVQIHGGSGFMRETEVNILYRSAKLLEIGGGTRQMRQLLVGGALLKD